MPQLDSLRAFAFLAVAASHWITVKYPLVTYGGTGVQLFFVLSGFLITGILLDYRHIQEGSADLTRGSALRTFYARRFFRIFPLFYAVIAAAVLLNVGPVRELWPWHAAYGSNFLYVTQRATPGDPFTHFWSLAVEEQFYLVWPFLVFYMRLSSLKWLILGLIIFAPVFRLAVETAFPELHRVNYLPLSCGDSLGAGAFLALALRHEKLTGAASKIARTMGIVGITGGITVAGLIAIIGGTFWLTAGHTFLVLVFGWLVYGAAKGFGGVLGIMLNRPELRFLGKISYGLYVFHHFFTFVNLSNVLGALGLPAHWSEYIAVQFLCRLTLTLLVAVASWYLYEKPLNNLKRHFTLRKKVAASPSLQSIPLTTGEGLAPQQTKAFHAPVTPGTEPLV